MAFFNLAPWSTAVASTPDCLAAIAHLEEVFKGQPQECKIDSDCVYLYYRVDSCAPPIVLPKVVATPAFEKNLSKYQIAIRTACSKEWSSRPGVCEPQGSLPKCKANKCIDASRP